ncbi:PTS sugar transporter subunit IIA [Enterococcus faecalis]|nr:PTS sugar transporter subunit IIA [Enterococcus faecalis]
MLKEKLIRENILVLDSVDHWETAIKESVLLLEKNGSVPPEYKDKIIEAVYELGPYIFIAPEIALPHVQYVENTKVGVSLLKLNQKIDFDSERNARLFFSFSAKDGESHMELIQELALFLSEEQNVNAIINMTNEDDIFNYIQIHG